MIFFRAKREKVLGDEVSDIFNFLELRLIAVVFLLVRD